MSQTQFSKPVHLILQPAGAYCAQTPAEALHYLDFHWSGARGAHFRRARSLCLGAINGAADLEMSRQAVEHAATKAGLLGHSDPLFDVTDSDFVGYFAARDIVDDPSLSVSRKKEMLAFWASDRHAVTGCPALRTLRGVTVTIDSLFDAMEQIDAEIDLGAIPHKSSGSQQSW